MENTAVTLRIEDYVGIVTLNRPQAGNALNEQMAKELMDVAIQCSEDENIRVVVITGAGNRFSVGGDLTSFAKAGEAVSGHILSIATFFHQAISCFARMNKPFIGAINGIAAGAGMSMVCACDMAFASNNAKFAMAYNRVGLTPDGSGSYFLPRIVGMKRAFESMYANKQLSANEAKEWGIINDVIPADYLLDEVVKFARTLAKGPVNAYGATKKLFYHSLHESLESQMSKEAFSIAERAGSEEGKEGISAFLEKREANFTR